MKRLKVIQLSAPFLSVPPVKYGGTERIVDNLVKGLSELCEIKLLATGDSIVNCHLLATVNQHLSFADSEESKLHHEVLVNNANMNARRHFKEMSGWVELYHSHYNVYTDMLREMMEAKEIEEVPILTTLHGTYSIEQQDFFKNNSHLSFNSISHNQRGGYPPNLNWVGNVYNSVDTSDFPMNINPENYVCFLGRLDPEKLPHKAIEIAHAWNIPLILAGKIDHLGRDYFDEKIAPKIDGTMVKFIGELDVKEKAKLLANALINLHPTNFREPFGLTICEAACTGTPTLAIRKGALPEIIEQGRTGICVEDFEEGQHRLHELLSMKRKYISVRAKMLFNIETMAEEYLDLYYKLVTD